MKVTDLTHVTSLIRFLDLSNVQIPSTGLVVSNAYARIVRNYSSMQTQYRLIICSQPSNLTSRKNILKFYACSNFQVLS